ncbi:MAG: ATP-binding protein [Saprospiraceae bacterium]
MIILVAGLPGSGKTTFAEALADSLGASHFNTDKIRIALGKTGQYDNATKILVYEQLLAQIRKVLKKKQSVIVDATFYKKALRQPYIALAHQFVTPIKYIEIKASEAVIQQRMQSKRKYSEADFEVYQNIKKQYEPITEPHFVLWSDQLSLAEMVEKAKAFLIIEKHA